MHETVGILHISGIRMRLQFCFVIQKAAGENVPQHTHNALELVYYVEGRGSSTVAGQLHRVGRAFFTITPAGVHHDQVGETALTSICLGLEGSGLEARIGCHRDEGGALGRVCERLAVELKGKAAGFEKIAEGLSLQAVGLVERIAMAAAVRPVGDRLVDQAIDIIRDRAGAISVAELADQLYVSKDYLRHLFQEHAQASPLRHIIQTRIATAQGLLADRALSIQAIAERSGFDSVYYFSRAFKKETGQTPTQFRGGR